MCRSFNFVFGPKRDFWGDKCGFAVVLFVQAVYREWVVFGVLDSCRMCGCVKFFEVNGVRP